MELFKLLGTIAIENAEAIEALDETSKKGSQTESKLSRAFSSIGRGAAAAGKAIAGGLAVGAAAMAGLTAKALQLTGDLEQNMGGSEAVFGKYAGEMQQKAKEAFSKMGLSTSDYLATANKMGSLFQGAGFTVEESMKLSSDSMQRAADVASIMGLDTSAAMEAVAGAAKGNFTMMDNLGVAMNETTLANYALEKGMEKSYDQMTQQEKIGVAMEMFLDKTAYAADNYAKENETLAGSLGTAKAALTNFLDGSGDVDSLVGAFKNAATVIVDSLTEIAPRLVTGVTEIVQKIIPMLPPLLQQLLPVLVEGAAGLINGLVSALPDILGALTEVIPLLMEGISQIVTTLIQALPELLPQLVNGLILLVTSLCEQLPQIIQVLLSELPNIINSIITALIDNLPALIQGLITLVVGIVQAIPQIIQSLIDALPTIISLTIQALLENLPVIIMGLIQVVVEIVKALPQIFMSLIQAIPKALSGIWEGLGNVFGSLGSWLSDKLGAIIPEIAAKAKQIVSTIVNFFAELPGKIWNFLKQVVTKIVSWASELAKAAFNAGKTFLSNIVTFFSQLPGKVWGFLKSTASSIASWVGEIGSAALNAGKKFLDNVVKFFKQLPGKIWDSLKKAASKVASWAGDLAKKGKEAAKSLFDNIVNGVKAIPKKMLEIGKDIVKGIWEGIKGATKWLKDKITGFCKDIWKGIKNFFGINSPSTVMRDTVGRYLAEGIAVGIEQNADCARLAADQLGEVILTAATDRLEEFKVYNDMTLADEVAFWDGIRQQCAVGTDARLEADKKYFEAKDELNAQMLDAEQAFQEAMLEIDELVIDRTEELMNTFNLFEGIQVNDFTSNRELMDNLEDQVKTLEEYGRQMDELKARLGDSDLYRTIAGQGVKAINQVMAINQMTDIQLDEYMALYARKQEAAQQQAASQLAGTVDEMTKAAYQTLADAYNEMGISFAEGTSGIYAVFAEDFSKIYQTIDGYMQKSVQAVSSAMQQISEMTGGGSVPEDLSDGIDEGLSEARRSQLEAAKQRAKDEAYVDKLIARYGIKGASSISDDSTIKILLAREVAKAFNRPLDFAGNIGVTDEDRKIANNLVAKYGKYALAFSSDEIKAKAYAKAMNNPVLLKKPTIFGQDAAGNLMQGGEAGTEVVSGASTLMRMIQSAVIQQNDSLSEYMQRIIDILLSLLPEQAEAIRNMKICLDTGALVGELAEPMDTALGIISNRKERGR